VKTMCSIRTNHISSSFYLETIANVTTSFLSYSELLIRNSVKSIYIESIQRCIRFDK